VVEAEAFDRDLLLLRQEVKSDELTMDHLIPITRGGKSSQQRGPRLQGLQHQEKISPTHRMG